MSEIIDELTHIINSDGWHVVANSGDGVTAEKVCNVLIEARKSLEAYDEKVKQQAAQSELAKELRDFLINDPLNHHKEWLEISYRMAKALEEAEVKLKENLKLFSQNHKVRDELLNENQQQAEEIERLKESFQIIKRNLQGNSVSATWIKNFIEQALKD